jgi:hypothetical protein
MKKSVLFAAASALLAAGAGALWFGVFRERPKPLSEEERVAKLLVGSWKMTKCYHLQLDPEGESLLVFHADGRYESQYSHPFVGLQVRTGTYRIAGNRLHIQVVATQQDDERSWDPEIERITETELTLVGLEEAGGKRPRTDYQRTELQMLPVPPRPALTGQSY